MRLIDADDLKDTLLKHRYITEHNQIFRYIDEQHTAYEADKVLDVCAEVISKLPGLCERVCPIGCDYGTEESCKESWRIYLEEQLKEGIKDVEKHDIRKTNADRIRSMSDDELTDIILCPYDTAGKPANIMPCVRDGNIQELVSPEYCKKCMMDWLQSEVEE